MPCCLKFFFSIFIDQRFPSSGLTDNLALNLKPLRRPSQFKLVFRKMVPPGCFARLITSCCLWLYDLLQSETLHFSQNNEFSITICQACQNSTLIQLCATRALFIYFNDEFMYAMWMETGEVKFSLMKYKAHGMDQIVQS